MCSRALAQYDIVLDYFRAKADPNGRAQWFLSHLHSDHIDGLHADWSLGPLHVSRGTAALMKLRWPHGRVLDHLVAHDEWRWYYVGTTGHRVACVPADHSCGSVIWAFRLFTGSSAVYTGDYRPRDDVLQWLRRELQPVGLLMLDSSLHHQRLQLPSREDSMQALEACYQMARRHRRLLVVLVHTGGTELLVARWCKHHQRLWRVDPTTKDAPEVRCSLRQLVPLYEASGSSTAIDVLCVGGEYRRTPPENWLLVKPSAVWFLCHARSLRRYPLHKPVRDATRTWRVYYSNHASYAENMDTVRSLRPLMVTACFTPISPDAHCAAVSRAPPDPGPVMNFRSRR